MNSLALIIFFALLVVASTVPIRPLAPAPTDVETLRLSITSKGCKRRSPGPSPNRAIGQGGAVLFMPLMEEHDLRHELRRGCLCLFTVHRDCRGRLLGGLTSYCAPRSHWPGRNRVGLGLEGDVHSISLRVDRYNRTDSAVEICS